MPQRVFNFYCDPGHGWIKVPMKLIQDLGLELEVSTYSYYKKGNVYLEEDGDASLFITAMKRADREVEIREFHTNNSSRIRNYCYYDSKRARR